MKYLIPIFLAMILLAMVAVGVWEQQSQSRVRPGRMEIEIETVYEGSDLFVRRLNITANGATGLRLTADEGNGSWVNLAASRNSDEDLQYGEVILIADRSQDLGTDQRAITWLAQVRKKNGSSAGGPSRYLIPADTELGNFVALELPDGEFAVGEELVLGTVDGEQLTLQLEEEKQGPDRE